MTLKLTRTKRPSEQLDAVVLNGVSSGSGEGATSEKHMRPRRGRQASPEAIDAAPPADASRVAVDESMERLLAERLLQRGLATEEQLLRARSHQEGSSGTLGSILVEMGVIGDRDLAEVLGDIYGMPVVDLRRRNPDPQATALVSEVLARQHMAVPLHLDENVLLVSVADRPTDDVRALLSQTTGRTIEFVLSPRADVRWAIDNSYRATGGVKRLVEAFEAVEGTRKRESEAGAAEMVDDDAPVVQVVARILTQAKRDRASDVHIEPSQDIVRVRFRIDGALKEILALPASMGLGLVSPDQGHGGHEHR